MDDLEREACALVRQYGFFMPQPVRDFLRRLAVSLKWQNLEGELK
jgi:hypothetical protein